MTICQHHSIVYHSNNNKKNNSSTNHSLENSLVAASTNDHVRLISGTGGLQKEQMNMSV